MHRMNDMEQQLNNYWDSAEQQHSPNNRWRNRLVYIQLFKCYALIVYSYAACIHDQEPLELLNKRTKFRLQFCRIIVMCINKET